MAKGESSCINISSPSCSASRSLVSAPTSFCIQGCSNKGPAKNQRRSGDRQVFADKGKRLFARSLCQCQRISVMLHQGREVDGLLDLEQPVPVRRHPMLDSRFRLG